MSHILDQADELRKKAIELLLAERNAIDETLRKLAHDASGDVALKPREPRKKACTACGEHGHNARGCPKKSPDASGPDATAQGTI
jgi:hypothetical protein